MRGIDTQLSLKINGHRLDNVILTCLSDARTERWSIDLSAVLWLLDRIATGDIDARAVQDELRKAAKWESDCCAECDYAYPHFDEARTRYGAVIQRWEQEQAQLDPGDYPYILNQDKIHRLSCTRPPQPTPAPFPEDLHSFSSLFDACKGSLDAVLEELGRQSSSGPQRLSLSDVSNKIARYGVAAVRTKLCRACKPTLPDLDPHATTLQPACWAWPADPTTLDHLRVWSAESPSTDMSILLEQRAAFAMLEEWHGGRCAVCGEMPVRGSLVRDHHHKSGMIRGLLCSGCNTVEGRSTSTLFENYRQRPPVKILAIEVLYLPLGFRPGSGHKMPAPGDRG